MGQVQVVANVPGETSLFVSNGNATVSARHHLPGAIDRLAVTEGASNIVNVTSGTAKTVTATVLDTQGNPVTGLPLTWSSSNPATVVVSAEGAVSTRRLEAETSSRPAHLRPAISE